MATFVFASSPSVSMAFSRDSKDFSVYVEELKSYFSLTEVYILCTGYTSYEHSVHNVKTELEVYRN